MIAVVGEAFADLASGMSEAVVAGTAAVAQGLSDALSNTLEAGPDIKAEVGSTVGAGAETSKKARQAFEDMRTEMREEFGKNKRSFRQFIKNPAFDEGIRSLKDTTLDFQG